MKKYLFNLSKFIAIALIVIFFIEILCITIKVPKISYQNIYSKSQDLIPQINSNTILFLGDSRIEYGIKPLVIKNILSANDNINVLNMAMPNSNGLDVLSYLKANDIYPKLIILGYTPNYGRYTNHDLDNIKYSKRNRREDRIKYFLKQNYYVCDYSSILEFFKGEHPIHLNHDYDEWGGVNMTLYGNYEYKKNKQVNLYTLWTEAFSKDKHFKYISSVKNFRRWFSKGGTKIYGLTLPTSKKINEIEQKIAIDQNSKALFDKFFNYSDADIFFKRNEVDSIYFLDGSHLTQDYSILFSEKFAKIMDADIK